MSNDLVTGIGEDVLTLLGTLFRGRSGMRSMSSAMSDTCARRGREGAGSLSARRAVIRALRLPRRETGESGPAVLSSKLECRREEKRRLTEERRRFISGTVLGEGDGGWTGVEIAMCGADRMVIAEAASSLEQEGDGGTRGRAVGADK